MAAAATPAQRPKTGPRYDAAVERLTNLTFALQGAAQSGGNPSRSAEWIHANVAGYHENKHSFRMQLQRDVATLARAGVHIDSSAGRMGQVTGSTRSPIGCRKCRLRQKKRPSWESPVKSDETVG